MLAISPSKISPVSFTPTGEISKANPANSLVRTLNDYGIAGSGIGIPLMMAWKA